MSRVFCPEHGAKPEPGCCGEAKPKTIWEMTNEEYKAWIDSMSPLEVLDEDVGFKKLKWNEADRKPRIGTIITVAGSKLWVKGLELELGGVYLTEQGHKLYCIFVFDKCRAMDFRMVSGEDIDQLPSGRIELLGLDYQEGAAPRGEKNEHRADATAANLSPGQIIEYELADTPNECGGSLYHDDTGIIKCSCGNDE
jgi:hypothetical protein